MKAKLFLFLFVGMHIMYANEVKFGKVSKEEVSETQHTFEPDAHAAILYKKERVYYNYDYDNGWMMIKEAHYRIKIYDKEGLDWATLQVPLYVSNGDEERISGIKGYTFNLDNGKLQSEKLRKDGIFEEDVNKYRKKVSITMPEAREGSVLDIEYKVYSPLVGYMDDFWFQYKIPVNHADIRIEIPEYFIFKKYSRGFYPIKLNEFRESRKINVSYRSLDTQGGAKTSARTGELNFSENVYEVNATNLPSLREEKFTNNIDNYRTAIKFELASTQFPNSPYKNYSLTWEGVAKSIYEYDSFGSELRKTNYFKDEVDQIIAGRTNEMEKAMALFEFVKQKMTWDEYYGVSCSSDGVRKAYKEGTGNVAEINLMLTSMFRYAGLNANPILVSTRSNGIPLFPTTDGFNYVIAGIEVQDAVILFDATDKNTFPNVLPNRALNWMGRLVRKDGSSSSVDLIPKESSKEVHSILATINEDGSVEGKKRTHYTNQLALSFRNMFDGTDEESYLGELESHHGEMEISSYSLENNDNPSEPILETFEFEKEDQCEIIGDKIYVRPMLFLALTENPFKMENRDYPVDFMYPTKERYIIDLTIPEGYTIESLPESAMVKLPEGTGTFKYNILAEGNRIKLNVSTELNSAIFPSTYYEALKEYYKNLVLKESEKVVLSKA